MTKDGKDFVWIGEKKNVDGNIVQERKKIKDATICELQEWSELCECILNGKNGTTGKVKKLSSMNIVREKCKAELTVRRLMSESDGMLDRNDILKKHLSGILEHKILERNGISPKIFQNACANSLGRLSPKVIPFDFILRVGVRKESLEPIESVRESIGLHSDSKLEYRNNGMSAFEIKMLLNSMNKDYKDIPTIVLDVVANKLIPLYNIIITKQINKWNFLKKIVDDELLSR